VFPRRTYPVRATRVAGVGLQTRLPPPPALLRICLGTFHLLRADADSAWRQAYAPLFFFHRGTLRAAFLAARLFLPIRRRSPVLLLRGRGLEDSGDVPFSYINFGMASGFETADDGWLRRWTAGAGPLPTTAVPSHALKRRYVVSRVFSIKLPSGRSAACSCLLGDDACLPCLLACFAHYFRHWCDCVGHSASSLAVLATPRTLPTGWHFALLPAAVMPPPDGLGGTRVQTLYCCYSSPSFSF